MTHRKDIHLYGLCYVLPVSYWQHVTWNWHSSNSLRSTILDYKPELHRLSPTVYEVLVWSFNSRNKIQVQLYLNDTKMNNLINQKKLSIYDVKGF